MCSTDPTSIPSLSLQPQYCWYADNLFICSLKTTAHVVTGLLHTLAVTLCNLNLCCRPCYQMNLWKVPTRLHMVSKSQRRRDQGLVLELLQEFAWVQMNASVEKSLWAQGSKVIRHLLKAGVGMTSSDPHGFALIHRQPWSSCTSRGR